ncbi:unnamed protein product [Amoebophrya sp. A120]|nr:unnamed protein product [Amoebophrya sp. A120]|eukprot:GSA120T00021115001.1
MYTLPVDRRTNDLAPDVSMPDATLESGTVAYVKQQCNHDGEAHKVTSSSVRILPAPSSSSSADANSVGVVASSDVEMPDSSVTPPCGNDFCAAPEVKQPPEPLLGDSMGGVDVTVTLEVQPSLPIPERFFLIIGLKMMTERSCSEK